MTNKDNLLLKRMRAAIGSPCHWPKLEEDWVFRRTLYFYWQDVASRHHLDGEMQYYAQCMGLFCMSTGLVEKLEIDVERWRPKALDEFDRRTKFLRLYHHLSKIKHAKHWLPDNTPDEEIVAATVNGPAKFFPHCTIEFLQSELARLVRLNWHAIAEHGTDALFADFDSVVGAANGTRTRFVRYYLDLISGQVHSRPILESDKPPDARWTSQLLEDFGPKLWPRFHDLLQIAVIDEEPAYEFDESEDDGFETPGGGPAGLSGFQFEFGPEATCHQLYSPSLRAYTTQLMVPIRLVGSRMDNLVRAWVTLQKLAVWLLDQEQTFASHERFVLIIHWHHSADLRQSHIFKVGGSWIEMRAIASSNSRSTAEHTLGYSFAAPYSEEDIFRNITGVC
jgi:hypothetical protein